MASSLKKKIETLDDTKIDCLLLYMCIWEKYIANSVWDTIRHTIRSLLGIHLELGEHVRKSNP